MSAMLKIVAFFIAFLAVGLIKVDTVMSQQKCDPPKNADAYIVKHFPSFDTSGLTPRVSEQDTVWEVTYDLPDGVLGVRRSSPSTSGLAWSFARGTPSKKPSPRGEGFAL